MNESFYEATSPSLKDKNPQKEENGLFGWLVRHPKFILPLTSVCYLFG